ncbi:MAG: hypothetical protein FWH12_01645 [Treponema sp.]|nr:hypothetical protein [Treponema sp.]
MKFGLFMVICMFIPPLLIADPVGAIPSSHDPIINETDTRAKIMLFMEQPFVNSRIAYPNLGGYEHYEELYLHLGQPLSEYEIIKGLDQLEEDPDNNARHMDFGYYSIWALYLAKEDRVYIYRVTIELGDELLQHQINKNSSPQDITGIFPDFYRISRNRFNVVTAVTFFFGFDYPQINFAYEDEQLTRIAFTLVTP